MQTHPLAAMALPRWLAKPVLVIVTVALWLPTLAVCATFAAVMATGCDVNEARFQPCIIAGYDFGNALGAGLLMAFVAGPTLPFAIGATIVCVVLARRARAGRPPGS